MSEKMTSKIIKFCIICDIIIMNFTVFSDSIPNILKLIVGTIGGVFSFVSLYLWIHNDLKTHFTE